MKRTTRHNDNEKPYSVTIEGLQKMLSCGYAAARRIGEESGASVKIGKRRLFIVSKVERYLEQLATESEE